MKTALWTVQVLWGVFFGISGFAKILCYKPALWNQALQEVLWFSAVPRDLFVVLGSVAALVVSGILRAGLVQGDTHHELMARF